MTDPRNETDPLPNGWTWEQAIEAACERLNANSTTSAWGRPSISLEEQAVVVTVARLIAQHEKPPVDEATELLAKAFATSMAPFIAREIREGHWPKVVSAIRDALAKARAGK